MLTEEELALCTALGTPAFVRARACVAAGEVTGIRWAPEERRAYGRLGGHRSGSVSVVLGDTLAPVDPSCTCADYPGCAHPAALALLVVDLPEVAGEATAVSAQQAVPAQRAAERRARRKAPWEAAVAKLTEAIAPRQRSEEAAEPAVGLQFELISDRTAGGKISRRIALRPVVPGRTGWIRGGISWSGLSYMYVGKSQARYQRLLSEILALASADGRRQYYGYGQQAVFLEGFESRRIWDLLAEAQTIGLPLVQYGKKAAPVVVTSQPGRVKLSLRRVEDDMVLSPELYVGQVLVRDEGRLLVGSPAHGVAWWGPHGAADGPVDDQTLRLSPLADPLTPAMTKAMTGSGIRISARDEERFLRDFYPELTRRIEIVAADPAVRLPEAGPVRLMLTCTHLPGHRLRLDWAWGQAIGGHDRIEALDSTSAPDQAERRRTLIDRVVKAVATAAPSLLEPGPESVSLHATTTVSGDEVIQVATEILPRLAELDGVEVETDAPDYREDAAPPSLTFVDSGAVGAEDWFDLTVRVTVGGEEVAFNELFVALAEDRTFLILPSGTYFRLDRPEFQQLRDLIEESRALEDTPSGVLRVGRFQAGVWQELADLGDITGQAGAWRDSIRALIANDHPTAPPPVPAGLHAELRPYQRTGYTWLTTLYDHGLGGILADDMGLGKTLQALALICRVRESAETSAPFLVVAPASVVHNWASEAHRFTPDLTTRVVEQTRVRRGADLVELAAGADLVVTSYTLFRLEYEDYEAIKWDGLVLDEAQFIKNAQSQAYRCARRLPAPFKLAITGTPMENNLAELWSLCSVTAPGLFPRLDKFTEYYRKPIERERDPDRLAQLRRRIRPLILRRAKAAVAADLPDKQEQVIELDLGTKHRRLYQTYLQRERQKVLGLLGDMEKNRFEIFRSLTLLRQASLDVTLVDPTVKGVPSTKLDLLEEQIVDISAEGHRVLVFSQFTRFLDAARKRLEGSGIRCCYLDGSTRKRAQVIADFKSGDAPVFLISLKAGGFGLNLTEADYCILLDPWWNPATEAQAVDRTHRIGQNRPVMVYRLVAKDTIEEKVMALKARKAQLFSSVLDGGDFASARLTAADIRELLE